MSDPHCTGVIRRTLPSALPTMKLDHKLGGRAILTTKTLRLSVAVPALEPDVPTPREAREFVSSSVAVAPGPSTAAPDRSRTAPVARTVRPVSRRLVATLALATVLICGVASYLAVQLLLATNRTWIAPTLLSNSDARVVSLASVHQQEMARMAELDLHKSELEARLARVKSERTHELQAALETAIADTDDLARRKDALLDSIEASPYWLASKGDVVLAFVPYENLPSARTGAPLYACRTSLAICDRVGAVAGVIPGEITGAHPFRGYPVRGQLLRLSLIAPRFAERPVLFIDQPPLGF